MRKNKPGKDKNTNLAGIQRECKIVLVRKKEEFKYRLYNLADINKFYNK